MKPTGFPQRVQIEVTNNCNYACAMCPRGKLSRPLGFMAFDMYKRIIDECRVFKPMIWDHYLGEPLLHKDIFQMVEYAKRAGLRVGFSTNGSLLDKERIDKLLASGVDRVDCSLDALTKETYHKIRRNANFEAVEKNIERLVETKYSKGLKLPVISVQYVKHRDNAEELGPFIRKWGKLLRGEDFVKGIEFINWAGEVEYGGTKDMKIPERRKPCPMIWKGLVVLWDGVVIPCANDFNGRLAVGDFREKSLTEIWGGEEMGRLRQAHLSGDVREYRQCQGCYEWVLDDDKDKYSNMLVEGKR